MKKRFLQLICLFAYLLVLGACSDPEGTDGELDPEDDAGTADVEGDATPDAEDDAGDAADANDAAVRHFLLANLGEDDPNYELGSTGSTDPTDWYPGEDLNL